MNKKCLLAFNSNFTSFILVRSDIQHCVLQPEHQQPQCWSLTHAFLVANWVKEIFAIVNHKNIQTRDCYPALFLTGTLHQYHIILLLQIHFMNVSLKEIDEFERGVDHNIRRHPPSPLIVKRQEFDVQWGHFYKRSLRFGIENLKQYLRMKA